MSSDQHRNPLTVRRVVLPPLPQIDQGVRHLIACHDYVDATGQPVYKSGEFPEVKP